MLERIKLSLEKVFNNIIAKFHCELKKNKLKEDLTIDV